MFILIARSGHWPKAFEFRTMADALTATAYAELQGDDAVHSYRILTTDSQYEAFDALDELREAEWMRDQLDLC